MQRLIAALKHRVFEKQGLISRKALFNTTVNYREFSVEASYKQSVVDIDFFSVEAYDELGK